MTRPMTKSATARERRRAFVGVCSCLWWRNKAHASLSRLRCVEIVWQGETSAVMIFAAVLEVGDGDDHQQVQGHSQNRNDREQRVDEHSLAEWSLWLVAGSVVEMWKTKFTLLLGVHDGQH